MRSARASVVGLLTMLGCGSGDPYADPVKPVEGPVATSRALVWQATSEPEFLFVQPRREVVDQRWVSVGDEDSRVLWTTPTVSGDRLLALVVPGDDRAEDLQESLWLLPSDGRGDPVEIEVDAPFTSASLSPDGSLAVLHFAQGSGAGAIQNANQVAVVDLEDETVRTFTLNGFGGRLQSVSFPAHGGSGDPRVQVGDRGREIVAFLAEGELVLVDVADQEADQVAIRFFPDVSFSPEATLLRRPNDLYDAPAVFLRATSSSDVAMVTLVDKPDPVTEAPGFSAQISLLPVGTQASDFTTYDTDGVPYLVTLDPNRSSVVFTDIRTQQGFAVPLREAATRMLVRRHEAPGGEVRQLVAWREGGRLVHTLALDDIEDALGRSPRTLSVQQSIGQFVALDNDRALVGSQATLYVLDFTNEQVTPLSTTVPFDPRNAAIYGDRLVLAAPSERSISTVDLVTLDPESILLDAEIASFHTFADPPKVVVVHDDPAGYVTVVDADAPSRATSFSAWGLFYEDWLER